MNELNTIITLRQGTTADWADSTVILRVGEMGLEQRQNMVRLLKMNKEEDTK